MRRLFFGVVADDFTGASDAASFLVEAGVRTVLFNGIPAEMPALSDDVEAIVVATKTRSVPAKEAVAEMLADFAWLKRLGAEKLYYKYCATFDSTAEGNIGPVADAVLETYGIPYTVLCPALPVNSRTVKEGILYVNGIPLSESHMRNHPLTPMRDSCIKNLIEAQSGYKAVNCTVKEMEAARGTGAGMTWEKFSETAKETGRHYYVIPEYYENIHGDRIAETFWDLPFLTGGSGLAGALGRKYRKEHPLGRAEEPSEGPRERKAGKALLLAGSCSKITLEQIADYKEKGYPWYPVLPQKLLAGEQDLEAVFRWVSDTGSGGLVYSSQSPEEMRESQKLGQERVAGAIEQILSGLARLALENGYTRIISAGGETSGAVTKALGYTAFYIGASVAPGVPVMTPVENPTLRIVLKSGGFGQKDFFERALRMTEV